MLLTRALTAAVLLAAFLAALLWLEPAVFAAVVAVIVGMGAFEWARLTRFTRVKSALYAALCLLFFMLLRSDALLVPVLWAAVVFWTVLVPLWLIVGITPKARAGMLVAGIVALVPAGLAMAALPPRYLLMALGLVWIADTFAYLVGSSFGKRKLAPAISPGKSWEGAGGGAVGVLIYAIICATLDPVLEARVQGVLWAPYLAGALLLCAASVVGDLFESALKRQAGAKDSGKLLPGHGGVLDRIDSAAATLPLALLLLQAIGTT